ncbi:hypothetical protein [Teichococcus aestuarii]|uniref:Uncharacterized protein n=1 Tax=Teichococcus aestuarii TaxID=568898 RepID=A0A2U1UZ97_9PROT|nr:hypothetical protein [Pseudoroseomonas aestuarii]PWC26967.1 hypothetical protein CR165_20580 [Pseudoroseomonas aestuarii]
MKSLLFLRLGLTMLALAFGEWRVQRIAKAMEQEHGLPRGWLLQPGNAERFAAWERTRLHWRRALISCSPLPQEKAP